MAIYTKKGDKGSTKVFDKKSGQLVGISKKSCKIRAIGSIDELNSFLGIVTSKLTEYKKDWKRIEDIQGNLFVINSILAGSSLRFSKNKVNKLEQDIDDWEGSLPVLKNFIFYSGSEVSSLLFYARALCRKAERSLVSFQKTYPNVNPDILVYFNRLSDYLFMMARKVNFDLGVKEANWIPTKKK